MFARFLQFISNDGSEERINANAKISYGGSRYNKYDYLLAQKSIDTVGLAAMANDLKFDQDILKNSHLSIVNSLIMLNERRQKRQQQKQQSIGQSEEDKKNVKSGKIEKTKDDESANAAEQQQAEQKIIMEKNPNTTKRTEPKIKNTKKDEKIERKSTDDYLDFIDSKIHDGKSQWQVEKLSNPKTRDQEFQRLFASVDRFCETVSQIKQGKTTLTDLDQYYSLVRQGKDMLGIIELLNNNYSNNFLDIFRIS